MTFETIANNVIIGVFILIVLSGLSLLIWKIIQRKKEAKLPDEYNQAFDALSQSMLKLQKFEADRAELSKNITDAKTKISAVTKLIDGFTEIAEQLMDDLEVYETAIQAIASNDSAEIARAAGLLVVVDNDTATMMNSRSRDQVYWSQLSNTLSMELGIRQGFIKVYRAYARSMMHQVSQFKQEIGANEKLLALARTGKPLAEVNQQLELAAGRLPALRIWQINFEQELLESKPEEAPLLTGHGKLRGYLR